MRQSISRRRAVTALFGAFIGTRQTTAHAQTTALDAANPVILSISGLIANTGGDSSITFDRLALEALPQHSLTTRTPWYSGAETFSGVLLRDLLSRVGATGTKLLVVALNDYTSEIPIEDFTQFDVILALKRAGMYMPVSDKGPLFIVYPYDTDSSLRTEKYYSRSAWQVAQFVVE